MFPISNSTMLAQAKQARHKPNVVLQILIYLLVLIVIQSAMGLAVAAPTMIWLFTSPDYINAVVSGNLAMAMEMMNQIPEWLVLVSLLAVGLETILSIVYCRYIEGRSLRSMGFLKRGWLKSYAAGFGLGALMFCAAVGISAAAGTVSVTVVSGISAGYIAAFFVGYLVQGMGEEVMLRGYFMVSLTNRVPVAVAVGISSLAFSLLHLLNSGISWLAVINLLLFGVLMALYMLRCDNIWGACALHSAWNFFQGNIFGISVSGMPGQPSVLASSMSEGGELIHGGAFGLEGGLAVTIVLVAVTLAMLFLPKRNRETNP